MMVRWAQTAVTCQRYASSFNKPSAKAHLLKTMMSQLNSELVSGILQYCCPECCCFKITLACYQCIIKYLFYYSVVRQLSAGSPEVFVYCHVNYPCYHCYQNQNNVENTSKLIEEKQHNCVGILGLRRYF